MKIKFRQEYFAVALSVKSLWPDQRKGRSLSVSLSIEKNSVVCLAHHDKTKENRIIELVPKSTGDRSWVCSRIFQNHINSLTFCLDSARQPAIARWPILEHSKIKTNYYAANFTNGSSRLTTAKILRTILLATALSELSLCFPSFSFLW